jgi:hypothetical protein
LQLQCGATTAGPLRDFAHRWPDRVFAASRPNAPVAPGAGRQQPWTSSRSTARPSSSAGCYGPLEENDEFRFGVVEVSQENFERILQAWNDEGVRNPTIQATLATRSLRGVN